MHDYSEYADVKTEKLKLDELQTAVSAQTDIEAKIEGQKAELKESEAHLRILSTKTIPDLMDTLGMGKFTTTGGHEVSIREFVRGSIPKARTDEAITWLNENGHERLVKQQCVIDFGREDEAWAQKFLRDCAMRIRPLNAAWKRGVHPQTLQAWAREQLANGIDIPMELFGIFRQRMSKVVMPK